MSQPLYMKCARCGTFDRAKHDAARGLMVDGRSCNVSPPDNWGSLAIGDAPAALLCFTCMEAAKKSIAALMETHP